MPDVLDCDYKRDFVQNQLMKSIAFINTGSGRNLGDRAMLVAMMRFARARGGANIYVSADLPENFREEFSAIPYPLLYHCIGRFHKFGRTTIGQNFATIFSVLFCLSLLLLRKLRHKPLSWKFMEAEMINIIHEVDGVIFSGGGYLTDRGAFECRACLLTGWLAQCAGKPLYFTGQGIGPFDTWLTKAIFRRVATGARFIALRDPHESAQCIMQLGVNKDHFASLGDDAFLLIPRSVDRNHHCRCLALHFRQSAFIDAPLIVREGLAKIVREARANGWSIKYFIFSERAKEELDWIAMIDTDVDMSNDIVEDSDPRVLCERLGKCTFAIGFAYHFILFALCQGVTVRALYIDDYYRQKMMGLLAWFDKCEWGINIKDFDPTKVVDDILSCDDVGKGFKDFAIERLEQIVELQSKIYEDRVFNDAARSP